MNQTARAAQEQNKVTGEIPYNIHQISSVVTETASGAHQTAQAASSLSALPGELQQVVGRFKL